METKTTYNFVNGFAELKEGAQPLNVEKLRDTKVYAKLMLAKGVKANNLTGNPMQDFLCKVGVDGRHYIQAELFILNKNNTPIFDERVWLKITLQESKLKLQPGLGVFTELIHPTVDLREAKLLDYNVDPVSIQHTESTEEEPF